MCAAVPAFPPLLTSAVSDAKGGAWRMCSCSSSSVPVLGGPGAEAEPGTGARTAARKEGSKDAARCRERARG